MRDFSTVVEMSISPENSKRPPTRRNSRISVVRRCWFSIHNRSRDGESPAILPCPSGEGAYPPTSSRRDSNSRTRALLCAITDCNNCHGTRRLCHMEKAEQYEL